MREEREEGRGDKRYMGSEGGKVNGNGRYGKGK
jgi:hypothetical protein